MEIIYYIINFLILALIIVLLFGKKIISIFRDRRIKIEKDLDSAENIVLPVFKESPNDDFTVEDNNDEAEYEKQLLDRKIKKLKNYAELECRDLHISKVKKERKEILSMFFECVKNEYELGSFKDKEAVRNERIIDDILSKTVLTSGDLSYIKRHKALYVTLVSAYPLSESIINKVDKATNELVKSQGGETSFRVDVDKELIGGVFLRIGDTVYDGTVKEQLYLIARRVENRQITEEDTVESYIEYIENQIKKTGDNISLYQRGRVISVSDGICWMDGVADIMYGEIVEFECGERGMVLDIQKERIGCVIFGRYELIESYSKVRRMGQIASVPVGEALLGRVVNAIGNPIDERGRIEHTQKRPIEFASPSILDRKAVCRPLHTGIKAIDAMVPIGKGQRELIIGDRQTGKTAIAVDTIVNQKGKNVICIYVGIGQKESTLSGLKEKLEAEGAMDYTVIVAATASDSASMQYIAPFSATAMAEYFMYEGKDVLIIYDDLSKHAVAYRELSLLLQRPSGREAYPGDIFYLHSRLLERSAQLSDELGGGSITALPIVETQAGDISSYIPTNVISITDGQIFLESELFHSGQRPAVNVGLSVSRVGGAAQTKIMKQVSSDLRTKLAQYRELAEFTQFGADVDDETKKTLNSGEHLTEALKQNLLRPLDDWKQALLIFVVSNGLADNIDILNMNGFEKELYNDFENNHIELVNILKSGNKMDGDTAKRISDTALDTVKRF